MMSMPYNRPPMDRCAAVQGIRDAFARSPILRDAVLSDPLVKHDGAVTIDVSFDQGPTVFRVVAPTVPEAYALLHELATSTVEAVREPGTWEFCGADAAGITKNRRGHEARGWLPRRWRP